MAAPVLLLTRPEAASRRFAARLPDPVRQSVHVAISALIDIVPKAGPLDLSGAAGVIFTSANGVEAVAPRSARRDMPAYCVGPATQAAARAEGWTADALGGTADALVDALIAARPSVPLYHLRGEQARGSVARRLTDAGYPTIDIVVYAQRLQPLDPLLRRRIENDALVIAPLFSPRTARQFAAQTRGGRGLSMIALSPAVAAPLARLVRADLHLADRPDGDAMVVAVTEIVERLERRRGAQ